ncbi:unnamed protein product [Rotaria magnacalcarata]|uniref:C-type lectin domain-containing protein n=5 Tax=Rotaria magnacalcarata TaxID=392030 RepID=A0A814XJN1_9BILA|nr:unnamed protein product [Rotaria magnacalcarata]CAF2059479.1 unnamed protein product [Rotaria magnacalcarata]CAF3772396.1 unnamed protein product [Rotaria magnacalcarata]CAF3824778.1 unnamed protein product [Rotaria magnacalcarata]CAF3872705.1 unnamed protein product [Rotaria magnacalcarata]
MMRIFLLFILIGLASTTEHWFIFDLYQFPGFYTPLFTLISSSNNQSIQQEQTYLSFALSTYDRSIIVDISMRHHNGTIKQKESPIQLNIQRADLVFNTINHMIFVVIRNQTILETYVNCKLIDLYLLYSPVRINEYDNETLFYKIENITGNIEHYEVTSNNETTEKEIFEIFSCKQTNVNMTFDEKTTSKIERPLIRKMQHIIEKVQRRKLRSKRQQNQSNSMTYSSDSFTIVYKPNIDKNNIDDINFHTIFNISTLQFHIQYYPNEHLFKIQFNSENYTEFILYAEKSTDRIVSLNSSLAIFLHITSTMITCYVNCEFIDQEFIIDSVYIENIMRQIMNNNQYEYNRQSTLILFNKTIDEIAEMFFCVKLDKKNQDLLPDKYAIRKFANALDVLANNLDNSMNNYQNDKINSKTLSSSPTTQSISTINIPLINGFGSLRVLPSNPNIEKSTISHELVDYDKSCSIDENCDRNKSSMICQSNHCICPKRLFWSTQLHRCIICHDLLIGNRCFRLSNHKSTWHEANDYCQNDNISDDEQEYIMRLASNLNHADIQYLKQSFLHNHNHEHNDYMYWIGATSDFTQKTSYPYNYRTKRHIPTTIFRWYDNHEVGKLNLHDIWCSQTDYMHLTTINNDELCVSIASCGLHADDCHRNYRFICEAI